MGQFADDIEKWGADVIFGRAKGLGATMARIVFRAISLVFGIGVRLRLRAYRRHWKTQGHLGTMVISVGNITVGGTGKTPVVEFLARTLRERGREVAILSRGYKSKKLDKIQEWGDLDEETRAALPKIVSDGEEVLLDRPQISVRQQSGVRTGPARSLLASQR